MITLAWHIFLVVWFTGVGCTVGVVFWRQPHRELERRVREQVMQTRLAELQSRERKALDA